MPNGRVKLASYIERRKFLAMRRAHDISAVLVYRSKFLDCLRGAVTNSYPSVDLLWDNVIAGPKGWPRSDSDSEVSARHPAIRRVGTLCMTGKEHCES